MVRAEIDLAKGVCPPTYPHSFPHEGPRVEMPAKDGGKMRTRRVVRWRAWRSAWWFRRAGPANTMAGSRGRAWERTVAVTRQAERLGFESVWVFDHFQTEPEPTDELTFESFTTLAALAASTERVRLGHVVICTAFRNPAADGQDDRHPRRHQRRPDGARHRRRLEGGRVARVRLRLSRYQDAPGHPAPTTSR